MKSLLYEAVSNFVMPVRSVDLKKRSIEYHIMSQKHISGKKLALVSKEESRIQNALHVCNSRTRLVGEGLPDSTQVYRVKVMTAMLKAGVPLRDLLEEHGYALTSSTNLRQLIPFIHVQDPRDGFGDYHSSSPERSHQRSQQP